MSAITIYSLPNELLEAIAVAGQEGRVPDFQGAFKSEWTLSHISRHFREVIVGTPALWTLIETKLADKGSVEILKLYLARSGGHYICAALRGPSRADIHDVRVMDVRVMEERLGLIVPHIHRILRLSVVFTTQRWGRQLLSPFRDIAAPNLQHLEIAKIGTAESTPVELFSSGAPRLTFLKMDGFFPIPVPPWAASLTHLEFRGRPLVDANLVEITALCPSLIHFYLDFIASYTPNSRFRIPSLKFLHLSIMNEWFDLLSLLDLFDAPAVTDIRIDGTHGKQICQFFNSPAFPHASFPALTTFSFSNNWCAHTTEVTRVSPPLRLFPALSSLILIKQCFMRNLVDDLLSQPWPLLETVTLYPMESDVEEVCEALLAAIHAKRQRGELLPKFRLSSSLFSGEAWRDAGADVEILDPLLEVVED
ncbi:hypothetical protein B0H19DRAFT_1247960 [Mycena capillaripes]|nr:hypothetical protein B0H19DRAFT_1247960 [Mycena capillaripes]